MDRRYNAFNDPHADRVAWKAHEPKVGREVWGWLEYAYELSDSEIEAYDLVRGY